MILMPVFLSISDVFFALLILGLFLIFVLTLFDIVKRNFDYKYAKTIWIAILIFLPVAGMVLYYIFINKLFPQLRGKHFKL